MKLIKYLLAVVLIIILNTDIKAMAYSNENTGTGIINACLMKPLTIKVVPACSNGQWFRIGQNSTRYFNNNHLHYDYTIIGENNAPVEFFTSVTPETGPVTITVSWTSGFSANDYHPMKQVFNSAYNQVDLNSHGKYYIRCEVKSATATSEAIVGKKYYFYATVTASYYY